MLATRPDASRSATAYRTIRRVNALHIEIKVPPPYRNSVKPREALQVPGVPLEAQDKSTQLAWPQTRPVARAWPGSCHQPSAIIHRMTKLSHQPPKPPVSRCTSCVDVHEAWTMTNYPHVSRTWPEQGICREAFTQCDTFLTALIYCTCYSQGSVDCMISRQACGPTSTNEPGLPCFPLCFVASRELCCDLDAFVRTHAVCCFEADSSKLSQLLYRVA